MLSPHFASDPSVLRAAIRRASAALAICATLSSYIARAQPPATNTPDLAPSIAVTEVAEEPVPGPPPPPPFDREALRPRRRGLLLVIFGGVLTLAGTLGILEALDLRGDGGDRWYNTDGTTRKVFASGLTFTLVGAAMITGGAISVHHWRSTQRSRHVTSLQLHLSALPNSTSSHAPTGLTLGVRANF